MALGIMTVHCVVHCSTCVPSLRPWTGPCWPRYLFQHHKRTHTRAHTHTHTHTHRCTHLAVESAGTEQSGVQDVGAVGGGNHNHASVALKAIHLSQQLQAWGGKHKCFACAQVLCMRMHRCRPAVYGACTSPRVQHSWADNDAYHNHRRLRVLGMTLKQLTQGHEACDAPGSASARAHRCHHRCRIHGHGPRHQSHPQRSGKAHSPWPS